VRLGGFLELDGMVRGKMSKMKRPGHLFVSLPRTERIFRNGYATQFDLFFLFLFFFVFVFASNDKKRRRPRVIEGIAQGGEREQSVILTALNCEMSPPKEVILPNALRQISCCNHKRRSN